MAKCVYCEFLITLDSISKTGWCKAPAGRKHCNQAIPIHDRYFERDCTLFKLKLIGVKP